MGFGRHVVHGFRALVRRSRAQQDDADEIRHYFDEAVAEYRARGMSRPEALRRVRIELGGEMQAHDRLQDYGWEHAVEALWIDLRYALRRLVGEPVFSTVTILTLAVGLGSATTIFSAVDTILLQPLPYPEADRIVSVWDVDDAGGRLETTYGTFLELTERSRSFDALAVFRPWQPTLSGVDTPTRLDGQLVSAGYFRVLGVPPALGRGFSADDDRAEADGARDPGDSAPVPVILSDRLWRSRFSTDPDVLGRVVPLDGRPFEIVGVMPPSFENVTSPTADLWTPLRYDMTQGRAWGHHLRAAGRLRPGLDAETAGRELNEIAASPIDAFARPRWAALERGLTVLPLQDEITGGVQRALLAVLGGAGLLLAIVTVNVSHLLLARGTRRRGEFALRTALGAGRERMVRQMLTESLVLAGAGGLAGLALATLGVRALVAFGPPDLPRLHALSVNGSAFLVALGLTTLIGIIFGLAPALQAASSDPRDGLQDGAARTTGGSHRPGHTRSRGALVVAEVALAVVLLVAAGLLLRSLRGLLDVEVGFDPSGLQTLQVQVSGDRFDNEATSQFFSRALEAVRAVPGVESAAFTSQLPLSGDFDAYGVRVGPPARDPMAPETSVFRYTISPGFFETLGIPLRRGRIFDRRDELAESRVVIVSESLARHRLPGLEPIGQPLGIGPADRPPYTIVGVVADVRQVSLALDEAQAVYVPAGQWHFADDVRSLVVRSERDGGLVADLRSAIWSVDGDRPIVRVATLDELVRTSVSERRFTSSLFHAFALASLFLAAAGIYGVIAGSVAERSREFGVRAALGASRRSNANMVIRQGLTLTALGLVAGFGVALVATQALRAMLFEVSHLDPVTYLGVAVLLGTAATLACAFPALRAGRVDPAAVLRAE